MEEVLKIAVGTFTMRPYVFAFFAAYLLAAVPHLGWKKVGLVTVAGYLIAFASEYSSINNGFPYGWYYYIDTTKDRELWIAGVPFFDSLSYVFLAYCSYATALFIISPLRGWRWNLVTLETRSIRRSFAALFLGSLLQVFLDIIIDPVALQGSRWFLGQIYGYKEAGVHYGVPLSNYLGWWLVGFVMILAMQIIDRTVGRNVEQVKGVANLPFRSLVGPILYLSVIIFNLTVTLLIGEQRMALTGIFTYILPVAIVVTLAFRRINRYSKEELADHLRDFPLSAAGRRKG
ncbi:carotenoid biosynthesis protein [Geobacter pelophilus]|uniref:Carotenoid biosynthesis protein n=1 Tax=Geoanaerobacter pelophilus TaxID=60036 RepID=A0AAW4L115_9BACT|nr:carotenoid biosynthesis protein [Geoanaerobacter pelophilus]MBT0663222.1 carotenoid biosynthesis protein [Geoanaerobacter pelophilus]